jgi:hypothetical protein
MPAQLPPDEQQRLALFLEFLIPAQLCFRYVGLG